MRYILLGFAFVIAMASCKKDTFAYNCTCNDKTTGVQDTFFTLRVQASGEANYMCVSHADTANVRGKNIQCKLD